MWFLDERVRAEMERIGEPTLEQQTMFAASRMRHSGTASRVLTIQGREAEIAVAGMLTNRPNFFASFFGGGNATYPEIVSALAEAESDPDVERITLVIDSPGGEVDGLFDTLAAIQAVRKKKPVHARVDNQAASAAYAIASQTESITLANKMTQVGSIGVAVKVFHSEDVIGIASTKAPKKMPDVTTEEGRAIVREGLDEAHRVFVEAIAKGRGVTAAKVNADYGQGATLLAEEAVKRGMADRIEGVRLSTGTVRRAENPVAEQPMEVKAMDLETLKREHPALYAAARQAGVAEERDRVVGHLTLGESSGAMKVACAAIKDGSLLTATLQATYMAAGMNRQDVTARQTDEEQAGAGDGASTAALADTAGAQVAAVVEGLIGKGAVETGGQAIG